jgi:hypothetical protein
VRRNPLHRDEDYETGVNLDAGIGPSEDLSRRIELLAAAEMNMRKNQTGTKPRTRATRVKTGSEQADRQSLRLGAGNKAGALRPPASWRRPKLDLGNKNGTDNQHRAAEKTWTRKIKLAPGCYS